MNKIIIINYNIQNNSTIIIILDRGCGRDLHEAGGFGGRDISK